jgi:hypothetical protein
LVAASTAFGGSRNVRPPLCEQNGTLSIAGGSELARGVGKISSIGLECFLFSIENKWIR